jgi:hypothetical protein
MTDERRTQLENMRDEIETAITKLVKGGVKSYKIGDRFFTYLDLTELVDLLKEIKKELNEKINFLEINPF